MKFFLTTMTLLVYINHQKCRGNLLIHQSDVLKASVGKNNRPTSQPPANVSSHSKIKIESIELGIPKPRRKYYRQNLRQSEVSDKDSSLKAKITILVQQTIHDTDRRIASVKGIKETHKDKGPYKIGFILSLIKKSKDVMNELFNVAVKHRDEWMALEQLKFFELIVHTNVDAQNLLRQLVELHLQNVNATTGTGRDTKRVILL